MNPETKQALIAELEREGHIPIDDDIFEAVDVPDFDLKNANAVKIAVQNLTDKHPNLFQRRDWDALDEQSFREQETDFRNRLSQPSKALTNLYKDLDTALLSPEQEGALRKYLSGRASKFDQSILKAALASQKRLLGEAS
jgi:hypothetical protein